MSARILDDLLTVADELTEPRPHIERVPYWDANRNRKFREHRITLPGLLAQLYEAAVDPVAQAHEGASRSKPASRPPLAVEALSAYEDVAIGALRWVRSIKLEPRVTPQSNIRAIVGQAGSFDLDTLEAAYAELRTWRRWAAVLTGWETSVFRPRAACPQCDSFGSIRANGDQQMAFCNQCQTAWEGEDLLAMAAQIRLAA